MVVVIRFVIVMVIAMIVVFIIVIDLIVNVVSVVVSSPLYLIIGHLNQVLKFIILLGVELIL